MSYDLGLYDPVTKAPLELDVPHQMRGGTYCEDGEKYVEINITYNYAKHFYRVMGED